MILMWLNPFIWPLEGVGTWNGFARIKIITSSAIKNNKYINSYNIID